jgi:hypothetical protein
MKEKIIAFKIPAFVAATSQYWLFAQPAINVLIFITKHIIFELQVMP